MGRFQCTGIGVGNRDSRLEPNAAMISGTLLSAAILSESVCLRPDQLAHCPNLLSTLERSALLPDYLGSWVLFSRQKVCIPLFHA